MITVPAFSSDPLSHLQPLGTQRRGESIGDAWLGSGAMHGRSQFFQTRRQDHRLLGVGAVNGPTAVSQGGLRIALGHSGLCGSLGPRIPIGVKRNAIDPQPLAALAEFSCPIGFADRAQIRKQRPMPRKSTENPGAIRSKFLKAGCLGFTPDE